jgi:hypothetical protein
MVFMEIVIVVYSENHTKPVNVQRGKMQSYQLLKMVHIVTILVKSVNVILYIFVSVHQLTVKPV